MKLNERLELIKLDYETRNVRVIFLKNYDKLPTPSGVLNVKKGDEIDLPRWQALMLENKGIVEIKDKKLDLDLVNTYHYREKRRAAANQITPLPPDFYMKAKELVEELNRLIQEKPTHMLLKDREILEKNLIELAEARLLKILRLALTSGEGFKEKMTPEENLVYSNINETAVVWRKYIESIFKR
ncbi:MAG: DNA replication complex GINS family protein [Desulfurococcales archaeon]|nr:DNA replication complex GINS family protein [Desulfurococcales archaeon]